MIAALTCAAGLLLTGTAHAYPIKDEALTKNSLYSAGALAETECAEKPVKDGDRTSVKKYLLGILDCLNTSWQAHLEGAGLEFTKPVVKIYSKGPTRFCGSEIGKDWESYHCPQSRTIIIQLPKYVLEDTGDLYLFHLMNEIYTYHVLDLVGIGEAYRDAPYRNKTEMNEQVRRHSLQAECLAGAFLKSVWSSLDRPVSNWNHLLKVAKERGDVNGGDRVYGKSGNVAYWIKRGYTTGDPASCNTWTASASKVA
ncbi:zinc protease [Planobispora longispora]|uniref:Zinc protease n=1 Tax=Planobispora longispora TaxID=28887 RepID=A0A8J3RT87_9ACTN|nr:zinc protease [Planobispora longispora]